MTGEQRAKGLALVLTAIIETINECPDGCPGGPLYMALASGLGISFDQFEMLMAAVVKTGRVKKVGHCYYKV
jgi:hypothetical protein